jgi:hypothetical protein
MPVMSRSTAMGHNQPPSPIDYAREAMADLANFLTETPVIQTPEQAKQGSLFVERSRKTLQDLDDARKNEVSPLNERVKGINEQYRSVRDPMDNVLSELRRRLTDYTAREEARRIREAELARQAAADAEMEARRAEEAEREAKANATLGEVTDVAAAIVEADQKFANYTQAARAAQLAESQTHVRLSSQLGGKALSLREKELLIVTDMVAAVSTFVTEDIGTHHLHGAILTAARLYRKVKDKLPPGVKAEITRSI